MNNLTLQQKVIIINNFGDSDPENAKKVCLLSNKDKQKGKYSSKCTKIAITQAKIERQIDTISNSIDKHNKKKAFYKKCKSK